MRFWKWLAVAVMVALAAVVLLPGLLVHRCIVAGTLVDTPSGPRAIETLSPGDEVWTARGRGRVVATQGAWAMEHLEIVAADGSVLRATAEHPVATGPGWTRAGALKVGDAVGATRVSSIRVMRGLVRVHDLEVEPDPTFIAGGVLVHNKSSPESNAVSRLLGIVIAEMDFRANDRDDNSASDFWVADVRGLHAMIGRDGQPLRLTDLVVATADLSPRAGAGGRRYDPLPGCESMPNHGYWFGALRCFEDDRGRPVPYDDGTGRHPSKFGFIAVPAAGGHAQTTFIVSEENTIWKKKLGGAIVDTFPRDPAGQGWMKAD